MFIFRLFHRDNPFQQIEARLLAEGLLRIGRDPEADWPLVDPEGTLSRIHCTLEIVDGRLWLRDESTNGTFLDGGERAPSRTAVEVSPGETLRLGGLRILIDAPGEEAVDPALTTIVSAPTPQTWTDDDPAWSPPRGGSLLEAFCEGARLDASAFSATDPEELMRRAGAIYQQTLLGLSTLMAQRARLKNEYQLERTTIGAADNNPFKWAPTRKLAQELLCGAEPGFLSDAAAVRASFQDLIQHLAAVAEGAGSAGRMVLERLDPAEIEAEARSTSSLLRSRAATCWEIHNRRYGEVTAQTADAPLRSSFQIGYGGAADAARR